MLRIAAHTDVGRVRAGNEDSLLVSDDGRLIAVADGMGGHQGGEVASATAVATLRAEIGAGRSVEDAVVTANRAVHERADGDPALRGMGTTLTAGIVTGSSLRIAHVGDSRAYLLRNGELRQVTVDHSVVAELIAAGELTEEEALVDRRRSMITRALGIDREVAVDVVTVDLRAGDRLLLCSDGLTTMLRDPAIRTILGDAPTPDAAATALVDAANAAGGVDNITVIVADVTEDHPPDGDEGGPTEAPDPEATEAASVDAESDAESDAGSESVSASPPEPASAPAPEGAHRRRWWSRRAPS
ncbi:MAG: Stp1/IreP family PP2C-type Ser/Thr phosphatase [Actinomycetota bacterium]